MTQQAQLFEAELEAPARHLSRKFLLALLVVLVATGLLWAGKIDAVRWGDVTTWVVGLYMLGNGATAWAAVWGRR